MDTISDTRARRKALGWNRAELARRAALDKRVVQLIEMGQWSEEDALGRIQYVLQSAESGDIHVQLEPPRDEGNGVVPGR
ncbi:MAG: hypothetical protein VX000_10550 [Myxococcota bacterium]|nr:hypothetical protein [Myxococcota bacterium]